MATELRTNRRRRCRQSHTIDGGHHACIEKRVFASGRGRARFSARTGLGRPARCRCFCPCRHRLRPAPSGASGRPVPVPTLGIRAQRPLANGLWRQPGNSAGRRLLLHARRSHRRGREIPSFWKSPRATSTSEPSRISGECSREAEHPTPLRAYQWAGPVNQRRDEPDTELIPSLTFHQSSVTHGYGDPRHR